LNPKDLVTVPNSRRDQNLPSRSWPTYRVLIKPKVLESLGDHRQVEEYCLEMIAHIKQDVIFAVVLPAEDFKILAGTEDNIMDGLHKLIGEAKGGFRVQG
jgi:hypothetical protein